VFVIGKADAEWLAHLSPGLRNRIIYGGKTSVWTGWFRTYRNLKKLEPDLIISSLWKSVWLSVIYRLLNPKVKLAGFFHSPSTPHFVSTFFMKILSWVQDTSFADSYATQQFLKKFYRIKNSHIIPFVFTFPVSTRPRDFDPTLVRMAYFGRLSERKGVDRTLEFCRLLKKEGVHFRYDLFGDGPLEDYNQKIRSLGLESEVTISKSLPIHLVTQKMACYDFLLQLSDFEGMALAVVEAMNCGLVPIVTPVGEIRRYSKDGINAIWLEGHFDRDLESLVPKVKAVIEDRDLYKKYAAAAAVTFLHDKKYNEVLTETLTHYLKGTGQEGPAVPLA
ncbi:MAG: glycosyltransferase family 4 protein, partial [Bacteroidota bacterium]|nr:glycosyltransferase family 4 protein [Bacteroidota bacterium]